MIAVVRIFFVLILMVAYSLHCLWNHFIYKHHPQKLSFLTKVVSQYSKGMLWILGFKINHVGAMPPQGSLIIPNHLSYIDILTLSSLWPAVFVTSIETKQTPGLGHLCRLGGSLFVERRRHFVSRSELSSVAMALSKGMNVVVFPEATTSDGTQILPFKRAFLKSAQMARAAVTPVCINVFHESENSKRELIPYFGPMNFLSHLFKVVNAGSIKIEVKTFKPLLLEEEMDLKLERSKIRSQIVNEYVPIKYEAKNKEGEGVNCLKNLHSSKFLAEGSLVVTSFRSR